MRYMLIIVISVFILFAACAKKATMTSCYACIQYDSLASNIPAEIGATTVLREDTLCNNTDATIHLYMKTHITIDTFYRQNDTFKMHYQSYKCTPE